MQSIPLILAFSLMHLLQEWRIKLRGDFYILVFTGAFLLVTLLVFLWAVSFRDPTRRKHRHRQAKPAAEVAGNAATSGGEPPRHRHRHRHRRKKHRPVNPTLAETGGLPAARDSKTPPKSQL